MDTRETERFLKRLYLPGQEFEVAYIRPETDDQDGSVSRVVRSIESPLEDGDFTAGDASTVLGEMKRAEENGYNVYVGVLPIEDQKAERYTRVWVDQDDPTAPYPFSSDERWEGANWPEPTTLVRTSEAEGGFRWQAIWELTYALNAEDGRDMVKRLARISGADLSVHDPRRVLRVPGIMNAKRGQMSRLISSTSDRYGHEAFELPSESYVEKLLNAEVNNPQHVLGEWLEGADEGDRNRKAYVVARFMKSCGVIIEDAAPILKMGAMRANPPLEDHELYNALKSAYHRA